MKPKPHVIPGRESEEVALGAEQPQFQTLPTLFFRDHEGRKALSAWTFESDEEEEEFARTRTLFVSQIVVGAPRAIMPSVFPPEIPEQADAEPEEEAEPEPARAVFEFRLVPLDGQSGNPRGSVETGARVFLDLTSLALQFAAVGGETSDPTEVIERHLDTFSRTLAHSYGADVYFRLYGNPAARWHVTEGRLESGAHERRTVRAGNSGLPDRINVAALDIGGRASVAEAVRMLKGIRNTFLPPFRLLGYSDADTPDRVHAFAERIASTELLTLPDLVKCFREIRPEGDFCLLIAATEAGEEKREGVFLLDLRLYDKARSN